MNTKTHLLSRAASAAVLSPLLLALVSTGLLSGGCSSKPPTAVQQKKFVGTWVEIPPMEVRDRSIPAGRPLREIEISDDNTFEMTFPDIEGQSARGTWRVEGDDLWFETTEEPSDEGLQLLVPKRFIKVDTTEDGETMMEVRDAEGFRMYLVLDRNGG